MQENENHINHTCPNCETTVQPADKYCVNCGQKQTSKKLSLSQLFRDFIDNVFNVDARIWRTMGAIFIPGKLTQAYFLGKHQTYSHPIRVFLIASIIVFTISGFKGVDFIKMELVESDLWKKTERNIHFKEFHGILDSVTAVLKTEHNTPSSIATLDSLKTRMLYPEELDSIDIIGVDINIAGKKLNPIDIVQLEEDELIKKIKPESFFDKILVKQFVRVIKKTGYFANFIWSNFPLMLLLMMPALAFLMKLVYFRRGHYFVEHLVFSFHTHAFFFLVCSVLLLFDFDWLPEDIRYLFGVLFGFYLFGALYNYYGQSIGKTIAKFLLLTVGYYLVFIVATLITVLISALLF